MLTVLKNATPGIAVNALAYPPAELKNQAMTYYFQIDAIDALWQQVLAQNELLALHVDSRIFINDVKLFLIN